MHNIFVFKTINSKVINVPDIAMPWTNNYKIRYYKDFINCFLTQKPHLTPNQVNIMIGENFIVNNDLFDAWKFNFKCNDEISNQLPNYHYYQTLAFFKIIHDLGANFTKLLHVGIGFLFSPKYSIEKNKYYRIIIKPKYLYKLTENKVILELTSYIINEDNQICVVNKNDFVFTNTDLHLPVENMRLKYCHLRKREPTIDKEHIIATLQESKLDIQNYSRISGDYNPVHSNKYIARLFGFKKIFMHGSMLSNYILKNIMEHFSKRLWYLDVVFTNPSYENEPVSVRINNTKIEVVNKHEQLKLVGYFKIMD